MDLSIDRRWARGQEHHAALTTVLFMFQNKVLKAHAVFEGTAINRETHYASCNRAGVGWRDNAIHQLLPKLVYSVAAGLPYLVGVLAAVYARETASLQKVYLVRETPFIVLYIYCARKSPGKKVKFVRILG